jgi:hypothetical protein
MKTLTFAVFISLISCTSFAAPWAPEHDPSKMDIDHDYVYDLNRLPTKATLAEIPWSETYWPTRKGSINVRWNTETQDGFKYIPPTRQQVATMSEAELAKLSPSEKYDLFMGHYDYPLWTRVKRYGNPTAYEWSGMCDGWSIAAIQYREPKSVKMANPDGIMIPFGSSDIKGLMTFAATVGFNDRTRQVGVSCRTDSCDGVNAGAMHVVMANQIGLKQKAYVSEIQPNADIWNQPTFGYEYEILGSAVSSTGGKAVRVHARMQYSEDIDVSFWEPVTGTRNFKSNRLEMTYLLDLDENDHITGGSWEAGSKRPDFLWTPSDHLEFRGDLSGINSLYQAI